jgi:hypothetical protein
MCGDGRTKAFAVGLDVPDIDAQIVRREKGLAVAVDGQRVDVVPKKLFCNNTKREQMFAGIWMADSGAATRARCRKRACTSPSSLLASHRTKQSGKHSTDVRNKWLTRPFALLFLSLCRLSHRVLRTEGQTSEKSETQRRS